MASWTEDLDYWTAYAQAIDPSIRLHTKRHWWWRLLGREQLSVYGPHVFVPDTPGDLEHDLAHEARHVVQQRAFGLGIHPWVGFLPWALCGALLPLPVLLTFRFWLELDAETFALTRKVKMGSAPVWARYELVEFATTLCSLDYLFSWICPWARSIAAHRAVRLFRRV